jgi:hypothetical protein
MACQFLRAMKAAPRMPQRQVAAVMSQVIGRSVASVAPLLFRDGGSVIEGSFNTLWRLKS